MADQMDGPIWIDWINALTPILVLFMFGMLFSSMMKGMFGHSSSRRLGEPKTEAERKETHLVKYGISEVPERGAGLTKHHSSPRYVLGPTEKMKGVLAQLKTYNEEGKVIDSEIVFRPFCEWYIERARDGYAETKYEFGAAIDEFGLDILTRVTENGEVVEVEREVPEGFTLVSCRKSTEIMKRISPIFYPVRGSKEYLGREEKHEEY